MEVGETKGWRWKGGWWRVKPPGGRDCGMWGSLLGAGWGKGEARSMLALPT